jgi:hypothetical protein
VQLLLLLLADTGRDLVKGRAKGRKGRRGDGRMLMLAKRNDGRNAPLPSSSSHQAAAAQTANARSERSAQDAR